ncbi:hypothetical protein HZS_3224 [Henneguya salminicola]|nr:hypothetical protein HZS_3224 [Henneguya salminicola]
MREIRLVCSFKNDIIENFNNIILIDIRVFYLSRTHYFDCMYFVLVDHRSGINEKTVSYFIQKIAQALKYLSDRHIVHRSIMAKTIFVDGDLNVSLSGFSQAREIKDPYKIFYRPFDWNLYDFPTHMRYYKSWSAPEILEQNIDGHDCRSDIFSLGITSIELLLGVNPFLHYSPIKLLPRLNSVYAEMIDEDFENLDKFCESNSVKTVRKYMKFCCCTVDITDSVRTLLRQMIHPNPLNRPSIEEILSHKMIKESTKPESILKMFSIN